MSFLSFAVLGLSLLSLTHAQSAPDQDPIGDPNIFSYRSRPDLYPPRLFVTTSEPGQTPGYIFMAVYQSYQNAATIYDQNGEVVWTSFSATAAGNVHDFQLCQYNNSDHLCYTTGIQYLGYSRGQSVILDTNLNQVRTVQSLNGLSALDQHEFNIINNTAIIDIYHPARYDLSEYNITTGEGWVMDSIFQVINLEDNSLVYEWSALNHVPLSESAVPPNTTEVVGTGFSALSPWDYFHINSIDMNANGDYLVSSRHTNTLYKINGSTGEIIWRCGGLRSDFNLLNGLNFSSQHDARWLSENSTTDVISLFDNASNGFSETATRSAGYIIELDYGTMTASLLKEFPAPPNQTISASQGSFQLMNTTDYLNSNAFINWGSQPIVTEYDPQGNIIFLAHAPDDGPMNYRGYKFNVSLSPTGAPALYTYAQSTNSDTVYYMSWNGCTNCSSWRVYGRSSCDGNYTLLGETAKTGFETNFTAQGYQEIGMVEAVAPDGTGIRNSSARGIVAFVPSPALAASCDGNACQVVDQYVMGNASDTVAETVSACAAQAVETSSSSSNTGSSVRPEMLFVAILGLLSTLVLAVAL